jgi:hypothetical protein
MKGAFVVWASRQLRVDNGISKIEGYKVKATVMLRAWSLVRVEEGCMIVSSTSNGCTNTPSLNFLHQSFIQKE